MKTNHESGVPHKVLSKEHLRMRHSFRDQVGPLRNFLFELHLSYFKKEALAKSFSDYIANGVVTQGTGFLKKHRQLFIQGLKVLSGDDVPDFTDFTVTSTGYPRHYAEIFQELNKFSEACKTLVNELPCYLTEQRRAPVTGKLAVYVRENAPRAQFLLTLLNWPKFIRLEHSKEAKIALLNEFADKVSSFRPGDLEYKSALVSERLVSRVRKNLSFLPEILLRFDKRTYKGLKEKPGSIPDRVSYMLSHFTTPIWVDSRPLGRCTVLSEPAGKSRIIVGYNGMVNATNVFDHIRGILSTFKEDCSVNQSLGHDVLQRLTADLKAKVFSCDLSNFTDDITSSVLYPFLDTIGLHDFMAVINGPILVGNRVVRPVRSLMGLRGTFELCSIIHHALVRDSGGLTYALCGDDLVLKVEDDEVERYLKTSSDIGLTVNRSKSVLSSSVGLFCGKAFWYGEDISPRRFPFHSLSDSSDIYEYATVAGSITRNSSVLPKPQRRIFRKYLVIYTKLKKFWMRTPIPKFLPVKLGGFGFGGGPGLLDVLLRPSIRRFVNVPKVREPPDAITTRRYIPFVSPVEKPLFWFTPNLLVEGWYKRAKTTRNVALGRTLKDLTEILEYFYSIGDFVTAK